MASLASSEDIPKVQQNEVSGADNEVKVEDYSNVAARTVANIKRLQENVLSVNISSSLSSNNISTVAIGQSTPVQPRMIIVPKVSKRDAKLTILHHQPRHP